MDKQRVSLKVEPGTALWALRESYAKVNANQLEEILNEFLKDSNVKITRLGTTAVDNRNFRIGIQAGIFLAIVVGKNIEEALTHSDPCIANLAKLLSETESRSEHIE